MGKHRFITIDKLGKKQKEGREQSVKAEEIEDAVYDLKAVNPNAKGEEDTRTPEELLDLIEVKGKEIAVALSALRKSKARMEQHGYIKTLVKGEELNGEN